MRIICWNVRKKRSFTNEKLIELAEAWGADVLIILEAPSTLLENELGQETPFIAREQARGSRNAPYQPEGSWSYYWRKCGTLDKGDKTVIFWNKNKVEIEVKNLLNPTGGTSSAALFFKVTVGASSYFIATWHVPGGSGQDQISSVNNLLVGNKGCIDVLIGDLNLGGNYSSYSTRRSGYSSILASPTNLPDLDRPYDQVIIRDEMRDKISARGRIRILDYSLEASAENDTIKDLEDNMVGGLIANSYDDTKVDHLPIYVDLGQSEEIAQESESQRAYEYLVEDINHVLPIAVGKPPQLIKDDLRDKLNLLYEKVSDIGWVHLVNNYNKEVIITYQVQIITAMEDENGRSFRLIDTKTDQWFDLL